MSPLSRPQSSKVTVPSLNGRPLAPKRSDSRKTLSSSTPVDEVEFSMIEESAPPPDAIGYPNVRLHTPRYPLMMPRTVNLPNDPSPISEHWWDRPPGLSPSVVRRRATSPARSPRLNPRPATSRPRPGSILLATIFRAILVLDK